MWQIYQAQWHPDAFSGCGAHQVSALPLLSLPLGEDLDTVQILSLPWFYQRIRLTEIHRTDINFLESQFWCYIPSEGLHTWNVMEVSPSFRQMGPVGAPAHRGGCCWLFAESTKEKSGDLSKPKTFTNNVQSSLFWLFNWHDLIWMSFVQTNLGDLF